jgi:hypothetical protein
MSNKLLHPSLSLLTKLGSIVVHTEEMLSPGGHVFVRAAIDGLLADPELREWLAEMGKNALLPVKRCRG